MVERSLTWLGAFCVSSPVFINRRKRKSMDWNKPILGSGKIKKKQPKIIKETKCTCVQCGKVWHYNKKDSFENKMNKISNAGKAMSCCGGCVPALFIKDKKVVDLTRCPSCNSNNVKCEEISYEVNE